MTDSAERTRRGDVWLVALGAGRPGEPSKTRPGVVVSADELVVGQPGELVIVVPLSSSATPSALRVEIAIEAGVDRPSRAICRAVRSVVTSRMSTRLGRITEAESTQIDEALRMILRLGSDPG